MRVEHKYYDLFPQMVPAGRESVITVKPLFGHSAFRDGIKYQVVLVPIDGRPGQTQWVEYPKTQITPVDGVLQIPSVFVDEQEYVLLIEQLVEGQAQPVVEFRLFALDEDLYPLRPYKGDIHMHSSCSDGKESPAYVAASCRKIGLDFIALTDHSLYAPSLEAIQAFNDLEIDLRIYPGEEVHPPDNPVHIVNFGGRFSVNDLFALDTYKSEVAAIEQKLTLPEGVNGYPYASCLWCFDKIREASGLGLFCHPYWLSGTSFDVPEYLTDLIFENQPYDALELISGYHKYEVESNVLQVARYHEERAKGKRIPVTGVSDAHGCEQADLFGWYYTIAFSKSPELGDLIDAVKTLNSVAVEALPGESPRAFGPFRLVRYAQYLMREVFPRHDQLCAEEGRLMLEHAARNPTAAQTLKSLKGRTQSLYDHLWGDT